jgi:hypothetical protein
MTIQSNLHDIVYLKDGDLHWVMDHGYFSENEFKSVLTDEELKRWGNATISIFENQVLIQSKKCGEAKVFSD